MSFSIRMILIAGFGGLAAAGVILALYIGLSAAFHNTRDLLTDLSQGFVDQMVNDITGQITPVETQARMIARYVAEAEPAQRDPAGRTMDLLFRALLENMPQVAAVAIIPPDGVMWQWGRGQDGPNRDDWSDNPGFMQWLEDGRQNTPPVWGPPVWLDAVGSAVIIHETPLFHGADYLGYLSIIVPIGDLSRRFGEIAKNGFILLGENSVLAHRTMIDWQPVRESRPADTVAIYQGRTALATLAQTGDPVLAQIWSPTTRDLVMLEDMGETQAVIAELDDREYLFLYRRLDNLGSLPWTIGTYIDLSEEDTVVTRLMSGLVAGLVVFALVTLVGLLLARAIGRPVRALARATALVREGRLDEVPELPQSRIRELAATIGSFGAMVAGLRDRERIRRTFGRYVPESVAEQLLRGDGGLETVETEATILFADIAGFTDLTEAVGPMRIVEVLNAYFSRMTAIIEDRGGVITQFQGDAILAIFNVPIIVADHGERAFAAAGEMLSAVEGEEFAGVRLAIRIGINTGSVVAGAVGAEGRLTYTVHGDAVNRAARVEAMNKDFRTGMLITEATARLLKTQDLRKMGTITVRGQTSPVTLFSPTPPPKT